VCVCVLLSYIVCSDAEIYRLRHEEHAALVERLRSSIEAHIHLLTKVRTSGVTVIFGPPGKHSLRTVK